ncbi:hypothetical protein ACWDS7_47340, partial [Streptosporangium sp. NPDC003464]
RDAAADESGQAEHQAGDGEAVGLHRGWRLGRTRFGNPASQLRAFIDTTGPLWFHGKLADKVYSAFTASNTAHGGQESTLLALGNTFYHWGGVIVPPGYTDPIQFRSGNPYGTSHVAGDGPPNDVSLEAARHQARRVVATAASLKAGRAA